MTRRTAAPYVALLLCLAAVAWAQTATVDVTAPAKTASTRVSPTFYRTVVSGAADSTTWTATPISPQQVGPGNGATGARDGYVVVQPRHTSSPTTAQIEVGRYSQVSAGVYAFQGIADVQTSTSATDYDGTGYYPTRPLYFDLAGCDYYDVRVTNVSSGSVSIKSWTIGQAGWAGQ